ncbi:hypothetical protein B0H14DRAFT_1098119 [Mycena olivaceomarginata]|nr:hypothetical protein B0H14DRAFT_1098119 [Mycena olivaceomarginata]
MKFANGSSVKIGHIAELKWAMKKMLLEEYPDIELTYTKGSTRLRFTEGQEGAGGDGPRGGAGGTGMAPQIGIEYLHRFSEIRGGTGGAGGAGVVEKPNVVATGVNTDPTPQRIVNIDGMIGTSEPPEVVCSRSEHGSRSPTYSHRWTRRSRWTGCLRVALVALVGRRKSLYHMLLSSVKLLGATGGKGGLRSKARRKRRSW